MLHPMTDRISVRGSWFSFSERLGGGAESCSMYQLRGLRYMFCCLNCRCKAASLILRSPGTTLSILMISEPVPGNEGKEKNMETRILGYIGTTIGIHSLIPSVS